MSVAMYEGGWSAVEKRLSKGQKLRQKRHRKQRYINRIALKMERTLTHKAPVTAKDSEAELMGRIMAHAYITEMARFTTDPVGI